MQTVFENMTISNMTTIIYVINFLCAAAVIFVQRRDPDATLAWVLVLFALPIVGLILYLIFSQNIARRQMFKLSANEKKIVTNSLSKQIKKITDGEFDFERHEAMEWQDLIKLNQRYDYSYFTQDNSVELFTDGNEKFNSLLKDIKEAERSINIEYFIVKWDVAGQKLIKALTAKAKEGVKVRLLLDGMGPRWITPERLREFKEAGGSYEYFFRPRLKNFLMRLNYRNHRKLVVIDNRIGYIGGFNIAREYLDLKPKFGHWRDTHVKIEGSAVQDIYARFALDWRYASDEEFDITEIFHEPEVKAGNTGIQIVASGPDSTREQIKRAYMKMITSAKECIYIQTPYYVPDKSIQEAIKMAAYSGVEVNLMIPNMPDHVFVYWATYSYVGDLLHSGARVYIYDNGFMHSKTITVDNEVSSVGSANFDKRSFSLNFEGNAIIYDRTIARKMVEAFEEDKRHSHELTQELYDRRSVWIRIKESISRLLTDIL